MCILISENYYDWDNVGNELIQNIFKRLIYAAAGLALSVFAGCDGSGNTKTYGAGEGLYKAEFQIWESSSAADAFDGYRQDRWVLEIPRKHLMSYRGKSGIPAFPHPNSGENDENEYVVKLRVVMASDNSAIISHPDPADQRVFENEIIIRIKNRKLIRTVDKAETCLLPSQVSEFMLDNCGADEGQSKRALCSVFLKKDGWSVSLNIHKNLMKHHVSVCRAVETFLDEMSEL